MPTPISTSPASSAGTDDVRVARAFNAHPLESATNPTASTGRRPWLIHRAAGDHRRHTRRRQEDRGTEPQQPGVARHQHEGQRRHGRGKLQHHRVDRARRWTAAACCGGSPVPGRPSSARTLAQGGVSSPAKACPTKPQQRSRPPAARSPCRIRRRRSSRSGTRPSSISSTTTSRSSEPFLRAIGGLPGAHGALPARRRRLVLLPAWGLLNAPEWLETTTSSTPNGTSSNALVIADLAHVVLAVNLGASGSTCGPAWCADDPDHADELRIDLDPTPGNDLSISKTRGSRT